MAAESKHTVLLVDSEPLILDVCSVLLERSGYRVLCSPTGKTGLQLLKQEAGEVDLVVSDILMADVSGPEMAVQMMAENPKLKIIFISAYGHGNSTVVADENILDKPFTSEQFLHKVRSALSAPRA